MAPPARDDVAVIDLCVGTYLRPRGLEQLLDAIAVQRYEHVAPPDLVVVVVDNDPDGSARAVVDAVAARTDLQLHYVLEPARGISVVRNTAVAATRPEATYIAFLDDDEEPEPQWLDALLVTRDEHDADAVAGPVNPRFEQRLPHWMERGGFHDREQHPTGTRVPYVGTGNVLVRAERLRHTTEPFDLRLALSGGEDTLFFMGLTRAGGSIVWAAEAVVFETVGPSRAKVGWILRRAYRGGNTFARCEQFDQAGRAPAKRVVNRAARGMLRILRGLVRVVLSPLRAGRGARAEAVNGLRLVANGIGVYAGLLGIGYDEYITTHGD